MTGHLLFSVRSTTMDGFVSPLKETDKKICKSKNIEDKKDSKIYESGLSQVWHIINNYQKVCIILNMKLHVYNLITTMSEKYSVIISVCQNRNKHNKEILRVLCKKKTQWCIHIFSRKIILKEFHISHILLY